MERREMTLPGLHVSFSSQLCSLLSCCAAGGAMLFLTAAGARDHFDVKTALSVKDVVQRTGQRLWLLPLSLQGCGQLLPDVLDLPP